MCAPPPLRWNIRATSLIEIQYWIKLFHVYYLLTICNPSKSVVMSNEYFTLRGGILYFRPGRHLVTVRRCLLPMIYGVITCADSEYDIFDYPMCIYCIYCYILYTSLRLCRFATSYSLTKSSLRHLFLYIRQYVPQLTSTAALHKLISIFYDN